MARKKPGLTLEQHQELGARLAAMHQHLAKTVVLLGNAYTQTALMSRHRRALQAVDKLRFRLDDLVFAENRDLDTKTLSAVYYPGG